MEIPAKALVKGKGPLFVICLETRCALLSSLLAFVHCRRQEDMLRVPGHFPLSPVPVELTYALQLLDAGLPGRGCSQPEPWPTSYVNGDTGPI